MRVGSEIAFGFRNNVLTDAIVVLRMSGGLFFTGIITVLLQLFGSLFLIFPMAPTTVVCVCVSE